MTIWRNMTAVEKQQHKYEIRKARRLFEAAARASKKGRTTPRLRHGGSRHSRARPVLFTDPQSSMDKGAGAAARRLRQIERGQLRKENGLVA